MAVWLSPSILLPSQRATLHLCSYSVIVSLLSQQSWWKKTQAGDFAELLRDNIELEQRGVKVKAGHVASHHVLISFNTYISKRLNHVRQLPAYQMLLVREARRYGDGGWKAYDLTFCQQAAS